MDVPNYSLIYEMCFFVVPFVYFVSKDFHFYKIMTKFE